MARLFFISEPENCTFEKFVLNRVGINRGSVAHVDVKHPIFCIGPDYGKIAFSDNVLFSDWVVGRIERNKNADIFIKARTGLPEIPLVCRGVVSCRQSLGHRMVAIINGQFRRQDWPIVGIKHGAAQKLNEPRPMGIFVIVSSDVEADPSAAVFHIPFERRALLGSLREIVEPQDQTIQL